MSDTGRPRGVLAESASTWPRRPAAAEVAALRGWLQSEFGRDPGRGMPPAGGLLYQPIPFAEFADLPCERNSSEDRFRRLTESLDYRGRRVLDLGCANGFFLFRLAGDGEGIADGLGIDQFPDNVRLARELTRLYGLEDRLRFEQRVLDEREVDRLLARGPWNVCHLLSVHHHLLRQLGISATRQVLRRLFDVCDMVVLEQGSLTQEEYEDWTGRSEPFDSGAFSRMLSMLESCGVPPDACRPLGFGKYLSGQRDDRLGSRRVLVAAARSWQGRGATEIWRKRHRNGIYMELVRLGPRSGPSEIWKNVVTGPSLARRELRALELLRGLDGFPQLAGGVAAGTEAADGLVRLAGEDLREVTHDDLATHGTSIRSQLVARLQVLAAKGLTHNEIAPPNLALTADGRLLLLDFETAYLPGEARAEWQREVLEPNPALGLGMYERELHLHGDWQAADLTASDAVLKRWGQPRLDAAERDAYLAALRSARTRG